jgi:hypothetical protein
VECVKQVRALVRQFGPNGWQLWDGAMACTLLGRQQYSWHPTEVQGDVFAIRPKF